MEATHRRSTDSRITTDSLKNAANHSFLIEEIRKRIINLERTGQEFTWVKAHVGIYGNELADHLAKAAASSTELAVTLDRTRKCTLYSEIEATQKWQHEWESSTKAAATYFFFPNVRYRIKLIININPNFKAMVTGQGKTRAYKDLSWRKVQYAPATRKTKSSTTHLTVAHYFTHKETRLGKMLLQLEPGRQTKKS